MLRVEASATAACSIGAVSHRDPTAMRKIFIFGATTSSPSAVLLNSMSIALKEEMETFAKFINQCFVSFEPLGRACVTCEGSVSAAVWVDCLIRNHAYTLCTFA